MDRFRGGLVTLVGGLALAVGGCQGLGAGGYSSMNSEVSKIRAYAKGARENPDRVVEYLDKMKKVLGLGDEVNSIEIYGAKEKGGIYSIMVKSKREDILIRYIDEDGKNGYDTKSSFTFPHELKVITPNLKAIPPKEEKVLPEKKVEVKGRKYSA